VRVSATAQLTGYKTNENESYIGVRPHARMTACSSSARSISRMCACACASMASRLKLGAPSGCRRSRIRSAARGPASLLMALRRSPRRSGFVTWSSMPACKHRSRSPIMAWAVNAMIGVGSRPSFFSYDRMCSVASMPPINGIDTSIKMISNGRFSAVLALNASLANDPFSAISTVCPYFSRIFTASF